MKLFVTFAERVTDYAKFLGRKKPCPGPGEIDTLAIDKEGKRVFVFEAKDIVMGLTPREIKNEIEKFVKPEKGYINRLVKKFDFLKSILPRILLYYGVKDPKGWEVEKAFVTSRVLVSAFSEKMKTDFLELEELQDFITKT